MPVIGPIDDSSRARATCPRSLRCGSVTQHPAAGADSTTPPFRRALAFWFKLGCISFGGPAGQIAIMHDELVERRRWISEPRFLHALSFCFALPGPEAQQLATYIGWRLHGLRGALAAGGLFVLPSVVVLVALSYVYVEHGDVPELQGVVRALGGVVVGLVLAALIRVGSRVIRSLLAGTIAVAAFAALMLGVPFPLILVGAAIAGLVAHRVSPSAVGETVDGDGETPLGEHRPRAWLRRAGVILAVWLTPVVALLAVGGLVRDLAGFFTFAALITFGGAYAVLPYVADQAVNTFGWLGSKDMVAGLALGETTPGPLIMVNTFVGYLAGWTTHQSHWWALAGALIVTFCTFAPSFVFILLGGGMIDRVPRSGPLAAAMNAIGIAVVGAIGALAVFVGRHVLWVDSGPDWLTVLLAAAALLAVVRFRLNVLWVIGAAALVGLVSTL